MHGQQRWPICTSTKKTEGNSADCWYRRRRMYRLALRVFQPVCFLAISLLTLAYPPHARAGTPPDSPPSLIAIGDVHGDFNDFVAILQRTGLIDEQHHWTGGKTTFVQVGDLIDRGPKPREVMDLLISLEQEAPKSGGRVVALIGNHEMMNLMGDLRYVTPENYASFSDGESDQRRKTAYQEYVAWRKGHSQLLAELEQPVLAVTEEEWMTRHPLGFIEQRDAFSPNGVYGKWVRQRFALAKIGGVIFLHGGISPKMASMKLDDINAHIHNEMKEFDDTKKHLVSDKVILPFFTLQETVAVVRAELTAERKSHVPTNQLQQANLERFLNLSTWVSVREDGPLWFRGYDQWSDGDGAAQVEKILAAYKATNLVVGHTVQKTAHIRTRFGGKVFLIDTGMLSSYYPGGKASALEIHDDDRFTATYLDQQEVLLEGKSAQSGQKDNK
jgi:hypothetical protein